MSRIDSFGSKELVEVNLTLFLYFNSNIMTVYWARRTCWSLLTKLRN